jgi:hypothetical protein
MPKKNLRVSDPLIKLRKLEAAVLDLSVVYQHYAVKVQPEKLDEAVRRVIEQASKER